MFNYFLVYNDIKNLDVAVRIEARPSKPAPEMEFEIVKIPGGKTLYREKGYNDIEITVNMNFISLRADQWDNHWRKVKKWLLSSGTQKLQFSDDLEAFYIVNRVIIETPERVIRKGATFQVTFICEPYVYIPCEEQQITTQLYNDFLLSKPVYRITGNGTLALTINSKPIEIIVGEELIIDTDKGLCYKNDGTINNVSLKGNYEDLYLIPGENTFNIASGFQVYITPNWRTL